MITRKHDFQPGTKISSDQVDEEFNNVVDGVNANEERIDNDLVPYTGASKDLDLNDKKLIGVQYMETSDINRDGSKFQVGELDDGTFVIRSIINGATRDVLKITKDGASSITIVRPDGYAVVDNGVLNTQHSVSSTYPDFYGSYITKSGFWMNTQHTGYDTIGVFFTKHVARTLVMSFFSYVNDAEAYASIRIKDGATDQILAYAGNGSTAPGGAVSYANVDLGVPTGQRRQIVVELRTTIPFKTVGARIFDKYLEG